MRPSPLIPLIPSTTTAPEMPPTRAFSRQLVAYIAVFLPVAPYFRANDGRISGICDDQYTATLESLEETCDEAIKLYLTHRGGSGAGVALALPRRPPPPPLAPPPAPPPAALGLRHRRKTRHLCRQTTRVVLRSSRWSRATAIGRHHQPCPWRPCHRRAGRRAKTHIEIICLQICVNVGIECDTLKSFVCKFVLMWGLTVIS
jgi:hypothetical protein